MKPRALMVISEFWPSVGGAEVQCRRLAAELTRRGHEVTVLTSRRDKKLPREETLDGFRVVRLRLIAVPKLRNLSFMLSLAWTIWRMRSGFDVIHAHQALRPAGVASLMGRLAGKPVVVKVSNGGKGSDIERMKNRRKRDWFSLLDPWLWRFVRRANRIVAISTEIRDELLRAGVDSQRVVQLPNGVQAVEASRKHTDPPLLPEGVRAVCISKLRHLKGIDVLLEAAKLTEGVHFDVVGDGPDRERLIAMRDALGLDEAVAFRGMRADTSEFLARAHIAVFPSRAEGMSNALLEAMARGMPCVATAVGGNRDLIEDGATGLLVPPEDPEALAAAILKLAGDADMRLRLGLGARRTVTERYTIASVADRYGALYSDLVAQRG